MKVKLWERALHLLCVPLKERQDLAHKSIAGVANSRAPDLDLADARIKLAFLAVTVAISVGTVGITPIRFAPAEQFRDLLFEDLLKELLDMLAGVSFKLFIDHGPGNSPDRIIVFLRILFQARRVLSQIA